MPKFCKYCGRPLKEGAKFCPGCGHPVAQAPVTPTPQPVKPAPAPQPAKPVQAAQPVKPAPAPAPAPQPVIQPKKRGGGGKIVLIFLLLVVLGGLGYGAYYLLNTRGEGGKKGSTLIAATESKEETPAAPLAVVRTEEGSLSAENPSVSLCDVTVEAAPEMFSAGSREISISVLEESRDEDGVRSENYELNMGAHERFDVPVLVTFPCSISSNTDVVVEHYEAETGQWSPLLSFVDREKKTVSAYFGSFSPARVSYLPVGRDPKIYRIVTPDKSEPFVQTIEISRNYWNILQRINPDQYGKEVQRFIDDPANYAIPLPTLTSDMDLKAVQEAYDKSSTFWTFCAPMISLGLDSLPIASNKPVVLFLMDNAEYLGNAMNVVPFVILGVQLAIDMKNFNDHSSWENLQTVAANLYKGLLTSMDATHALWTGYSHVGFTLCFLGVAVFGWELDYFVGAAKEEMASNVASVFNAYYNKEHVFDAEHWGQVFQDAYWAHDKNLDAAMLDVKTAVDAYCNEFWAKLKGGPDEDIWFAMDQAGYRKVFENPTPEQKQSLTEMQKAKVWKMIEKESMPVHIQPFLIERLQETAQESLYAVAEPYNKKLNFRITETVTGREGAQYLGYTVCLGRDKKPFQDWHITIPDDDEYESGWAVDFPCSVLGYLRIGMPDQVLLYEDLDDFLAGEEPDVVKQFTPNMKGSRVTQIELVTSRGGVFEFGSDDFGGYDWGFSPYANEGLGDSVMYDAFSAAVRDAVRKTGIKLNANGDFSTSSSGASSGNKEGSGPNSRYSYNVTANLSLNGHIDKSTGEGSFKMTLTVSYRHTYSSSYDGNDNLNYTYVFKVDDGEIKSNADYEASTFDPTFEGEYTCKRSGTWSHTQGKAPGDKSSSESMDKVLHGDIEFTFIANN